LAQPNFAPLFVVQKPVWDPNYIFIARVGSRKPILELNKKIVQNLIKINFFILAHFSA